MPLRDHFRSPLDDIHSWGELHGGWPMMIVRQLIEVLPEPYFAAPGVHLGSLYEVDVATYRDHGPEPTANAVAAIGMAVATYAPPVPTCTLEPRLPKQDVYEVRVFDSRRQRRLVAAIEIVSPSNKARAEERHSFIAKVGTLLQQGICVSIVDVVSTSDCNLYADLMAFIEGADPALELDPPPMYAATVRTRFEGPRQLLDGWYHALSIGQPLPSLPVWLTETRAISLDLEASYEETCRTLRIR